MGCRETQFLPFLKDLHQPWGSDFIGENEEVGIESERYDIRVCLTMGYISKWQVQIRKMIIRSWDLGVSHEHRQNHILIWWVVWNMNGNFFHILGISSS